MLSRTLTILSFVGASMVTAALADAFPFNPTLFKNLNVTRGLSYHYYASPAEAGKPTLLFLHGFPSTSFDWRHQVSFFQEKGYGLLVPDMLGCGSTAKPSDPQLYASSLVTKDIIDILDAENVNQAVVIGHDWGSKITSRLANYYPERFSSFAFLAVGYISPNAFGLPRSEDNNLSKSVLGYEEFGYWDFLSSEGADQIILNNMDSFFDIWFTNDTTLWIKNLAPLGALEDFVSNGRRTTPADYVTLQERAVQMEAFRRGGLQAALNWYKIATSSIEADDNQNIPEENSIIRKPVFYGAALRDYATLAAAFIASVQRNSNNSLAIHEYDSSHWVMLEARDEVNRDLLQWIEGLNLEE